MNNDTITRAKKRIAKLLNLAADSAAAEGEIANAMAAAQAMMDEHHLTAADVAGCEADGKPKAAEMGKRQVAGGAGTCSTWEGQIALAVAKIVGGVGVYQSGKKRTTEGVFAREVTRGTWTFYGDVEGIAIAAGLFDELRLTVATMAQGKGYGGVYKGEGRSYCEGFAAGIHRKLRERQAAERTATTTALVAVKTDDAAKWLAKPAKQGGGGVNLGNARRGGGGQYHAGAHSAGVRDGRATNASASRKTRIGGSQKRIG